MGAVSIDVFAAIPDHELRALGRRRRFARDEVVFHREDPGDSLHRIDRGRFAARIVTPLGEVATVAVHGPGEVFGLFAVLAAGHRVAETLERLVEALYTPATRRVVERLRGLAALYADQEGQRAVLIPLGQEHLAGLAGSTRETVNRVLKSEQQRGGVELGRNRITVHLDVLGGVAARRA